jgi:hypothetical protein
MKARYGFISIRRQVACQELQDVYPWNLWLDVCATSLWWILSSAIELYNFFFTYMLYLQSTSIITEY